MPVIRIFDNPMFPGLERTLALWSDERAGLYFSAPCPTDTDPFHGPTIELLVANSLAHGRGLIIHACGVVIRGKGLLFVGQSGAGKTTLGRLWKERGGAEILSDDRIILRKRAGQFWIYGTPWHGDARFASPRGVRLAGIFLLRQARENAITEVDGIDPVSRLLTCAFPTYWDPSGMAFTLEILADVTASVPCHGLLFRPDKGATDLVERILT
ncbi:MAG: hypothetical protein JRJ26_16750 [Deltaproteobacteria bacterium]|nr:hypothetical protein [Deltaproteobacteria bacterium]